MTVRTSLRRTALRLSAPVGSVRTVRSTGPAVVLTYDDGPDPVGTPAVLAALARHDVTATFFVLARRAERHRSLMADLVAAGHGVGLHGVDHRRLTDLPAGDVMSRLRDGRRRVEDVIGRRVHWFRPPYGAQSPVTWLATRACGLEPVMWSVAAYDWRDDPEEQLAARTLDAVTPGAVVLLHDGFAGPADGVDDGPAPDLDRGRLAELVLDGLSARGLAVSPLDAPDVRPVRGAWFRG